ncbi:MULTISPECIES: TetR/AcrR family transcriptional regulator [unclassified Streptomyces]|uniref:TetR/AcrR family transcriptional regulator n=1 Tax=unclassified Streptomyces TaxID=2593676 RepID=UPI0037F3E3A0
MAEPTESNESAPAARRTAGRPRDAGRDRALLEATVQVLQESGYGGLTTAAVAKRAGVSTATLYRRWRSKEDLVVGTAVRWAADLGPQPDTGTLEGDLAALLRDKAETLEGPGGRLLHVLIGEAAHNDTLARVLDTAIIQPVRDRAATLVRRAVARGDIPPLDDAHVLADLVVGSMVSRLFLTPGAAPPATAESAAPAAPSSGEAMTRELLPFLLRALGARTG